MDKKNPKYTQAQKEGKVDYSCIPWRIIYLLAQAMEEGAEKYGRFNYREDSIEARTYIASFGRHFFGDPSTGSIGWVNGEDIDPDSGLPHLIKIMANCLLVEDAKFHGKLIDNRLEQESKTPPAAREEVNAFGKADWFPPDTRIGKPHEPTMREKIDMDRPVAMGGPFEVRFQERNKAGDALLAAQTRGPYQTIEQAESYAGRNPERLPGRVSIHTFKGVRP